MSPDNTAPKRMGVLSEQTPLTIGLGILFLAGSAWLWRSFDSIGDKTEAALGGIRDEVAKVGSANQANAIQIAALKELVTFQLQAVTDGTQTSLGDIKQRLQSIEDRLRLAEAALSAEANK